MEWRWVLQGYTSVNPTLPSHQRRLKQFRINWVESTWKNWERKSRSVWVLSLTELRSKVSQYLDCKSVSWRVWASSRKQSPDIYSFCEWISSRIPDVYTCCCGRCFLSLTFNSKLLYNINIQFPGKINWCGDFLSLTTVFVAWCGEVPLFRFYENCVVMPRS